MTDNQHHTTKAYLNKFFHPDSKQKVLYPYARVKGKRRPTGTKHLGSADHFFDQTTEDGKVTNHLDRVRTLSESMLFSSGKRTPSAISKCIYEDMFLPARSDLLHLAMAAALLRCSSPVQIHNMAMMTQQAGQQYTFNSLNEPESIEYFTNQCGADAQKAMEEARQGLLDGTVRVGVSQEHLKQAGFHIFLFEEEMVRCILEMGLTVCTCHYKSFFITSDNPVVLTSRVQPESPGFRLHDAEVWFPISHRRGLLWSHKHRGTKRLGFGHTQTREMNRRVITWCYSEVYSPLPEDWIEHAVLANKFDPCLGHYGTLQEAIKNFSFKAKKDDGSVGEFVDFMAAMRAGKKQNVVGF